MEPAGRLLSLAWSRGYFTRIPFIDQVGLGDSFLVRCLGRRPGDTQSFPALLPVEQVEKAADACSAGLRVPPCWYARTQWESSGAALGR